MLMSLVIVGAALTWFFMMGGKDFLWDVVKLIFGGDLVKSVFPEKEQLEMEQTANKGPEERQNGEIVRRSEPIVRKPMLQIEGEDRLPMNSFLGKRIQPRI
jgi:hypothetical protein